MADSILTICAVNADWKKLGHARVAVSKKEGKRFSAAIFLVDLFCLGVKDVMGPFRSAKEFDFFCQAVYLESKPKSISFDTARDIVLGGAVYAESLGFSPAFGFDDCKHILGTEPYMPVNSITFGGPNGRPFYIVGPNDFAGDIIRTLEKHVGKDGFELMYPDNL